MCPDHNGIKRAVVFGLTVMHTLRHCTFYTLVRVGVTAARHDCFPLCAVSRAKIV